MATQALAEDEARAGAMQLAFSSRSGVDDTAAFSIVDHGRSAYGHSSACADDETDQENFDQTRNAGPVSMRDHPGGDWDHDDEMADESFPASDPPSFNPGTA